MRRDVAGDPAPGPRVSHARNRVARTRRALQTTSTAGRRYGRRRRGFRRRVRPWSPWSWRGRCGGCSGLGDRVPGHRQRHPLTRPRRSSPMARLRTPSRPRVDQCSPRRFSWASWPDTRTACPRAGGRPGTPAGADTTHARFVRLQPRHQDLDELIRTRLRARAAAPVNLIGNGVALLTRQSGARATAPQVGCEQRPVRGQRAGDHGPRPCRCGDAMQRDHNPRAVTKGAQRHASVRGGRGRSRQAFCPRPRLTLSARSPPSPGLQGQGGSASRCWPLRPCCIRHGAARLLAVWMSYRWGGPHDCAP
jgi:hypothetical protein